MKNPITIYPHGISIIIPLHKIDMFFLNRDLYEIEYTHDGYISALIYSLFEQGVPNDILLAIAEIINTMFPQHSIDWTLTFIPIFGGPTPRWMYLDADQVNTSVTISCDCPAYNLALSSLTKRNLV